jgi:hypothetical protein
MSIKYCVLVASEYDKWYNRFRNTIDRTLNGPESWNNSFVYDESNPDIIYILASQDEIKNAMSNKNQEFDIYGNPVRLSVTFFSKRPIEIMIDADNFINGVPISKLGKKEYRKYVINHETGHALGLTHLPCNDKSKICPVMYQMTKGVPNGYIPSYKVSDQDYLAYRP